MLALVVLTFSSITVAVFSERGAVNPPHTPKVNLQKALTLTLISEDLPHGGRGI